MKIAFILSTCAKSGPFIVACDIVNNIRATSIDVYYIKESEKKLPFKARLIKIGLFEKVDWNQYDIIHSHGFLGDVLAFLNRKKFSGKWLTTLHQKIYPDYTMAYNRVVGWMLEKLWIGMVSNSACVVSLTKEMADYYQVRCKGPVITFVYNGISIGGESADFEVPEKEVVNALKSKFIMMGISANLIYRKGIDVVIRAMARKGGGRLALLILGDGPERENLKALAANEKVSERCLFVGFKSEPLQYFKYFDVYVMASRSEGFGLCVIEAASQHVPVVCNDLSVYRELFVEGDVERFTIRDLESLVEAVNRAFENRVVLGDRIYSVFQKQFTASAMASNYLRLYENLLGDKKS